ncbi:MAG: hypothetical protein ABSH48_25725 [Verrucomicrobiota bacterium]
MSLFGLITLRRDYYHRPGDPAGGDFPLDQALGLQEHCTPAAARMICRTAAQLPYVESSGQLAELAELAVEPSRIQRLVLATGTAKQDWVHRLPSPTVPVAPEFYVSIEGTGVPMVPPELEGRAGKGADGLAKTREVKLAAFFTRTKVDEEGRPVRDPDSTTYLASFASSDEFGPLARHTAWHRGLDQATLIGTVNPNGASAMTYFLCGLVVTSNSDASFGVANSVWATNGGAILPEVGGTGICICHQRPDCPGWRFRSPLFWRSTRISDISCVIERYYVRA